MPALSQEIHHEKDCSDTNYIYRYLLHAKILGYNKITLHLQSLMVAQTVVSAVLLNNVFSFLAKLMWSEV